ncbi:MAG TPA: ABC transporter ATP-binding protein [Candidatus Bilamarchaeaceae archaeon]|nr:ABC transporter ATP-binding protein [Candidatus Bilamarchaeaceae archaeon]
MIRNALVELKNVIKTYRTGERDLNALDNLSLSVCNGDFITILGPSGCGKSTLLHILGLLDTPTSGSVLIDGLNANSFSDEKKSRIRGQKIGFVFQTFNLIPSLTALENVTLPSLVCEKHSDPNKVAEDLLHDVGLGSRMHHYPSQLSGGEKQRVAIARALINNPELILADEPTGNLDSKTGSQILKIFEGLNKKGKTIIIITHDISITQITKKTIRLLDGRMVGG